MHSGKGETLDRAQVSSKHHWPLCDSDVNNTQVRMLEIRLKLCTCTNRAFVSHQCKIRRSRYEASVCVCLFSCFLHNIFITQVNDLYVMLHLAGAIHFAQPDALKVFH